MRYLKCLLIALFLFNNYNSSAQNVNIPDPNFLTNLVWAGVDINDNGVIEVTEALNVTSLSIYNTPISDLTGIRSFTNLQHLHCGPLSITTLDLHDLPALKSLFSNNYSLSHLDISGCDNLESLACQESANGLTINFGSINKIKTLHLDNCNMEDLDLRAFDSLSVLTLNYPSYFGTLNISGLTKLENLEQFGNIGSLIARGCTDLRTLRSSSTTAGIYEMLDVTGCVNLQSIHLQESNISTLDLSTCVNLTNLSLFINTPGLQYLNIKNGSFATIDFDYPATAPSINICADDFEIDTVTQMIAGYVPTINISTTCSFFPGGNYNTIKGKIRLDLNNTGCNLSTPGMSQVPVSITDGINPAIIRYTAPTGNFAHYPYAGNFTITPYFPLPYFNLAPVSATIAFDTANSLIDSASFCITPAGIFNDLEITLLPATPARPGFNCSYVLAFKNRGTTLLTGSVQLNYDNGKMLFNYASVAPATQAAGSLDWNFSNLAPFESRKIDLNFNLLAPPLNNIGDTLFYLATINPLGGDETPVDNSFVLPQLITGSFDPNDKECLEGSRLNVSEIGNALHYIIRFQNLGNDTAFNVVVTDQLSDKYDWNSLEITASSHPCDIQQKNGKLEFFFNDIRLPYSTINFNGSQGFVAFTIKAKNSVVIGDSLNNRAFIYFDFNPPVITNTASTIVSDPGGPVPVRLEYFSINRKTEKNFLTWKVGAAENSMLFTIERSSDAVNFNDLSYLTATAQRCYMPFNFKDEKPLEGINYYRIKITNATGLSFYSKTLAAGDKKSGVEIVAVNGDHNNTLIHLKVSKEQRISMKLMAADGKVVYAQSKIILPGTNSVRLATGGLARGIYILVMIPENGEVLIKRFVK